jgi:arylamine N-acetyltransferase
LPSADLLSQVLRCFAEIPYENLSKIIRAHEELDAHRFQTPEEILVGHFTTGAGGTCFPLTETLTRLVREIGFDASPILADRRYGADTHCAVVTSIGSISHLIDPGYLIFSPIPIPPHDGVQCYKTPFSTIQLAAGPASSNRLDLATVEKDGRIRYRLTYKTTPVDELEFRAAWKRSFDWEMMTYPVVSSIAGESQIYVQKSSLTIRTKDSSTRTALTSEELVHEISSKLSISSDIVRKALSYLKKP